jgi:hypothetical protein
VLLGMEAGGMKATPDIRVRMKESVSTLRNNTVRQA